MNLMNLGQTLVVQLGDGALAIFALIVIVAVPIVGEWRRGKK
jgi:hypothetical protein